MQNTASFQATGFSAEEIFLGRAFEKYGVEPEFEQRYEYKNAVNIYTQNDFTAARREAMLDWMGSNKTSCYGNRMMTHIRRKGLYCLTVWDKHSRHLIMTNCFVDI